MHTCQQAPLTAVMGLQWVLRGIRIGPAERLSLVNGERSAYGPSDPVTFIV